VTLNSNYYQCEKCGFSNRIEIVEDLGYCLCCSRDFSIWMKWGNLIFTNTPLSALSTLTALSSEIPNAVNAVNVGEGGIHE